MCIGGGYGLKWYELLYMVVVDEIRWWTWKKWTRVLPFGERKL